ncbi:hypothetical protein, partial [Mycobacterium avium]|uniref:hypothetical protein n=1 Tax=Mycobacterium avium TaxID=1764 RepID=UPI001F1DA113
MATAPTPASPNEQPPPSSHEKHYTTGTSDTERHPRSDSSTYKVNGIGFDARQTWGGSRFSYRCRFLTALAEI